MRFVVFLFGPLLLTVVAVGVGMAASYGRRYWKVRRRMRSTQPQAPEVDMKTLAAHTEKFPFVKGATEDLARLVVDAPRAIPAWANESLGTVLYGVDGLDPDSEYVVLKVRRRRGKT